MNYNNRDIERIARLISNSLEKEIRDAGIFYRIFFRCKSFKSLENKLSACTEDGIPKYNSVDKTLRDVIGIRINLYFVDDLEIVTKFIKFKNRQSFLEETIDKNDTTEFKPTRVNLIFKIPEDYIAEFREVVKDLRIDTSFELQLRTIFSEGWHEVEHDFRYKCKEDWKSIPDLSRTFNGLLASLETHEWSTIQLFERMSYYHYKNGDLNAMIRFRLRLRLDHFELPENLCNALQNEENFKKNLYKLDRNVIIEFLLVNKPNFPPTLENILYLINHFFIKNESIDNMTPAILKRAFAELN